MKTIQTYCPSSESAGDKNIKVGARENSLGKESSKKIKYVLVVSKFLVVICIMYLKHGMHTYIILKTYKTL